MGLHSIAEVYAALTRLPVQPRIHPVEAARIVTDNILPHFEIVSLGKKDYLETLNMMASGGRRNCVEVCVEKDGWELRREQS